MHTEFFDTIPKGIATAVVLIDRHNQCRRKMSDGKITGLRGIQRYYFHLENSTRTSAAGAMQAHSESCTRHDTPRDGRLIATSFNDEQMRQAGALKHCVKIVSRE